MKHAAFRLPLVRTPHRRAAGFTLAEIMIVVVIIGLLAAIAVPGMQRVSERAKAARFVNDLRVIATAAETYALEFGGWPADGTSGLTPVFADYLPSKLIDGTPTVLGGSWDWDYNVYGVTAAISVINPSAPVRVIQAVDKLSDDNNLNSGSFVSRSGGYMWVLVP
jgi:prepilin-type N-terminal cleavage/methylation domain-containing protein